MLLQPERTRYHLKSLVLLYGMKPRESRLLRFYAEIKRRGTLLRTPRELGEALESLPYNILSGFLTDKQRAAVSYARRSWTTSTTAWRTAKMPL